MHKLYELFLCSASTSSTKDSPSKQNVPTSGELSFKVSLNRPEIVLVEDATLKETNAFILSVSNWNSLPFLLKVLCYSFQFSLNSINHPSHNQPVEQRFKYVQFSHYLLINAWWKSVSNEHDKRCVESSALWFMIFFMICFICLWSTVTVNWLRYCEWCCTVVQHHSQ